MFSKHSGTLVGFVDLGSVNHDVEKVMSGEQDECTSKKLASHAFVIMHGQSCVQAILVCACGTLFQPKPKR